MNRIYRLLGIGVGALVVIIALLIGAPWNRSLPDFERIRDIEDRKAAFFGYLLPYVRDANKKLLNDRDYLAFLKKKIRYGALNKRDIWWIQTHAQSYGLEPNADRRDLKELVLELTHRMDEIPPSLSLAQAALESAWGTSRFARDGNNLFGIRCYTPGCGIVPDRRPVGSSYEVAAYPSPLNCFQHYMLILNGNSAYRHLWALRENARLNGDPLEGLVLAGGLFPYSTEGDAYIQKVRQVIRHNQLYLFDPE